VNTNREFHENMFVEFCRQEIRSGGPDPHMRMAEDLALRSKDPLWFVGVYTAPYVVSTAAAITGEYNRRRAVSYPESLVKWVTANWSHLPIRKERRVNGVGSAKLAEIVSKYGEWLYAGGVEKLEGMDFHAAFKALDPPHYGRYFKTKLYEVLRRTLESSGHKVRLPEMPDIVPKGGAHPRKALTFFWPDHQYKSDKPEDIEDANSKAEYLKTMLLDRGVEVDWFVLEVLLCNYRQAVNGGQYPGRAHDSEYGHYEIVKGRFPQAAADVLACRSRLFPHQYLGEVGGRWQGRRAELGKIMMAHGYVWNDSEYDYAGTTDLAAPARNSA